MVDRVVSREEVHIEKSEEGMVEEVLEIQDNLQEMAAEALGVEEGAEESQEPTQVEYEEMAMKVILAIQNVFRMNDTPAALMIHPTIFEGLKEALFALPEQAFPAQLRDRMQFIPDPNCDVKIVTENEIEMGFFRSYFGPQGNGLLPKLQQYLQANQFPVNIDLNFLRTKFLLEICERLVPSLVRAPIGSELITGLRNDKR